MRVNLPNIFAFEFEYFVLFEQKQQREAVPDQNIICSTTGSLRMNLIFGMSSNFAVGHG